MTNGEAIGILVNEAECVEQGQVCDREYSKRHLFKEDFEIIEAFEMAIVALNTN